LEIFVLESSALLKAILCLLEEKVPDRNYLVLDVYWTLMKIQYSLLL